MPRTGADAFLPPETSGATGPLFGKRADTAEPAAKADSAGVEGAATERAEKVARVVPITALASRQRAQAEQEARSAEVPAETPAEEPTEVAVAEEPNEQPVEQSVEQPARAHDPLSDPLPADAFDEPAAAEQSEPAAQVETEPAAQAEEVAAQDEVEAEADVQSEPAARGDEIEVDADDPLGLGTPARPAQPVGPAVDEPVSQPEPQPVSQVVAEPQPEERPEPELEPVPSYDAAALLTDGHGLNGHGTNGSNGHGSNGHGSNGLSLGAEPARAGGESPIFKSMRSGWLAGEGKGEWHETEVDRGWEIAEHVSEPAPVVESTPVGLPRRAPGERLVPGSVTPPTAAKTRDPEAIRRRLQSHTAGVSRGRRAAQSSTQHTEAGPA